MCKTIRIIKDTKVIDTSISSKTDMEDMEVKVDSQGIMKTDHIIPSNVSRATNKVIDMKTAHTRTELI